MIRLVKLNMFLFLLIGLLTIGGCTTIKISDNMSKHMVTFNREGEAFPMQYKDEHGKKVDVIKGDSTVRDKRLQASIDKIQAELTSDLSKYNKIEVILYIHGGLKNKFQSSKEAKKILDSIDIENAKNKDNPNLPFLFPIFINWESGMLPSYLNHLMFIRQGREEMVEGILSSPLYLTADLGRTISRLPITYGYQGLLALKAVEVPTSTDIKYSNMMINAASKVPIGDRVFLGEEKLSQFDHFTDKLTYVFPGVLKLITTPVLDLIGKSAYEDMLRRTQIAFFSPKDYDEGQKAFYVCEDIRKKDSTSSCTAFDRSPGGGVMAVLDALATFKSDQNSGKLKFTLIGHSMGGFIATEILKRSEGNPSKYLTAENIVFMAAASSVREFQDVVIPYLRNHQNTKFYNLTLHPFAEEKEKEYWDTVPRGSLLVWIDTYATDPKTLDDQTFGQFNNAFRALQFVPADVLSRITLKGFGIDDCTNVNGKPQKHGDFNDLNFWNHDFWDIPDVRCKSASTENLKE